MRSAGTWAHPEGARWALPAPGLNPAAEGAGTWRLEGKGPERLVFRGQRFHVKKNLPSGLTSHPKGQRVPRHQRRSKAGWMVTRRGFLHLMAYEVT